MSDALPRPMSVASPIQHSHSQRSLRRNALSRLNSIRRERQRHPELRDEARPDSATIDDIRIVSKPSKAVTTPRADTFVDVPLDGPTIHIHTTSDPRVRSSGTVGRPYSTMPSQYGGSQQPSMSRFSESITPVEETSMHSIPRQSRKRKCCCSGCLSVIRFLLRIVTVFLGGVVIGLVGDSLYLYGNKNIDLRKGHLPITWPAHTKLTPTFILLAVAFVNFLIAVTALVLSCKRRPQTPRRFRDPRIAFGVVAVLLWAGGLAAFKILDNASKAGLQQYSCSNKNTENNGKHVYGTICKYLDVSFYAAIGAAALELILLVTLCHSARTTPKTPRFYEYKV